jgi:hypothetical protein
MSERFDDLTRAMAAPHSRRGVLRMFGVAAAGAAAATVLKPFRASAVPAPSCSGPTNVGASPCAAGTTPCGPCCCKAGIACLNRARGVCGCPSGTTPCGTACCKSGVACKSGAQSTCAGAVAVCVDGSTPCGTRCGACSVCSTAGDLCSNFIDCGPNPGDCSCVQRANGQFFCTNGNTCHDGGSDICETDADCPANGCNPAFTVCIRGCGGVGKSCAQPCPTGT